jgi:hypothetical protein
MDGNFGRISGAVRSFIFGCQDSAETEQVNKTWRELCKKAIRGKCGDEDPRAFQSNQELRDAVHKYCKYEAAAMEEIACGQMECFSRSGYVIFVRAHAFIQREHWILGCI